jgi:hypothetical protein
MIYKILHKLFGWDYIYFENTASHGMARVRTDAEGVHFYYWACYCRVDIIPGQVKWMTCKRDKYFKDQPKSKAVGNDNRLLQ